MFYPEDFKNRVKKAFPTWESMHQKLDSGDVSVGRYLGDNADGVISTKTVLAATSLEELQDKARAMEERGQLYSEWCKLYDEQKPC